MAIHIVARGRSAFLGCQMGDDLMAGLSRAQSPCRIVIGDATEINASPVYLKSWQKCGGKVEVVRPGRVLAVTTNPINMTGPDLEPDGFRQAVADRLSPRVPVHDVVIEAPQPRRRWRLWK